MTKRSKSAKRRKYSDNKNNIRSSQVNPKKQAFSKSKEHDDESSQYANWTLEGNYSNSGQTEQQTFPSPQLKKDPPQQREIEESPYV
jgi:hypothetical protein